MTKKGKGKKNATLRMLEAEPRQAEKTPEDEKPKGPPPVKLVISKGLDGFDAELEQLLPLFEQLQLVTTELADPELDLLIFAHSAHYFGVLTVDTDEEAEKEAADKDRREREDEDVTIEDDNGSGSVSSSSGSRPGIKFKDWKKATWAEIEEGRKGSMSPEPEPKDSMSNYINDEELEEKTEVGKPEQIPGPPEHTWQSTAQRSDDSYWNTNHIPDSWGVSDLQEGSSWNAPPLDVGQSTYTGFGFDNQVNNNPPPAQNQSTWNSSLWDYTPPCRDVAGFVYLTSSQQQNDYLRDGELRIGIILTEKHRGKGYGRQAIQDTLNVAFQDKQCNRAQAVLIDSPFKDRALGLFMKSGLGHEGVRRRGFRSPYDFEFKDVTYLGLLATDYLVRSYSCFGNAALGRAVPYTGAPKSLWDELFARHQREREELLRWEEKQERQLKRTSSMETIRQVTASADSDAYVSASERSVTPSIKGEEEDGDVDMDMDMERYSHYATSVGSERSWVPLASKAKVEPLSPKKRRRLSGEDEGLAKERRGVLAEDLLGPSSKTSMFSKPTDTGMTASISEWRAKTHGANVPEAFAGSSPEAGPPQVQVRHSEAHRGAYSAFSDDSDLESVVSDGYATSTSSVWDVVETGSTSGSSSLADVDYDALDIYDDSDDSEPHAL